MKLEINQDTVIGVVKEKIKALKDSKDWHYVYGMLDIMWMSGIIDSTERQELLTAANRKLAFVNASFVDKLRLSNSKQAAVSVED